MNLIHILKKQQKSQVTKMTYDQAYYTLRNTAKIICIELGLIVANYDGTSFYADYDVNGETVINFRFSNHLRKYAPRFGGRAIDLNIENWMICDDSEKEQSEWSALEDSFELDADFIQEVKSLILREINR
jgi:hypothetical protein